MNPKIKERWLALLESGEYNLGTQYLYSVKDDTHCPLGVLVELALDEGVEVSVKPDNLGHAYIDGSNKMTQATVNNWAGLKYAEANEIAARNDGQSVEKAIEYIRERL